ncbi:MAG: hypothetical protein L7H08_07075 [Vulcanisaeta sp.]|nr:hypothetical protein [Vulcanisaeta sp.]
MVVTTITTTITPRNTRARPPAALCIKARQPTSNSEQHKSGEHYEVLLNP